MRAGYTKHALCKCRRDGRMLYALQGYVKVTSTVYKINSHV